MILILQCSFRPYDHPLNVNGGPLGLQGWKGTQPPQHFFGFNEIHRLLGQSQMGIWHLGYQDNMHTDGA